MTDLDEYKKNVLCFQCLKRKETIDEIERRFLMLEVWIKSLRSDITELVHMKDDISERIADLKKEFESDWKRCL